MITAWTSCHSGSPVDGKVCQLQVESPLIPTVQIYRATSELTHPRGVPVEYFSQQTIMKTIYLKLFIELPVLVFARYIRLIGKLLKKDDKLITQRLRDIVNNIIPPTFNHSGIIFDATTKTSTSRGIRLLTKEPDTINWLDDYLAIKDTFYDVGANIGVYSLYAAKKGNAVIAIEPESSNYALLNKNIFLNSFEQKIFALNLALYDREVLSTLNMNNYQPGKSGHSFHDEADLYLNPGKPRFRQAVIGMPLDTLVYRYNLAFPNLIKIDVDGDEHKILSGMSKILKDQRLKSIAIETDDRIDARQLPKIGGGQS